MKYSENEIDCTLLIVKWHRDEKLPSFLEWYNLITQFQNAVRNGSNVERF